MPQGFSGDNGYYLSKELSMTEDEARTKICPQKMNLPVGLPQKCSGKDCMAWKLKTMQYADGSVVVIPSKGYCAIYGPQRTDTCEF